MKMMRFYHRAFILLAALALTPGATAAPFANGSFEQPGVASGTEETLSDGSTAIAGWTVNKGVLSAYNAASDFAAFGNPNGTWEYGYRTSLAGSFAIFDTPTNRGTSADFWTDSTLGGEPNVAHNGTGGAITPFTGVTLQPGQLAQHPGPNGEYSVIRWNPPHMGTFTVSVDWVGLNAATSTDVYVLLNGSQIYSGTVTGTGTAHYDNASLPNTLPPGIYFEFVVGNGGSSAAETDMTGVTITITEAGGDPGMVYVKDDAVPSGPASAFDGAHRVSFGRSGGRGGTLSQTFDTVPGMNYAVNYSITTEGTDDDGQSMSVEAFDGTTSLGSTSNNIPFTQGQWSFGNSFGFTATSTSTRLVFSDTTPLGSGANASWALDGVQVHFIVPGSANVWLAGWADGTTAANTDSAPSESPTLAPITVTPGQDITFDVIGGTHNGPIGPGTTDPDGGTDVTHETENSIAELKAPLNSLVGVFLDANQPSGSPAPYVDFTVAENRDYDVLMPGLQQPFFIGNGLTSTSGVQRVRIPAGATRLFLGSLDQFDNAGNFGSFGVVANVVAPLPPITEFSDFQISNGNFGEDWTFTITQDPQTAGRTARVQTRIGNGAWVDLPGGGVMNDSGTDGDATAGDGVWSLTTADIPLGSGRQFRVLAEADGFLPTGFEFAFPLNVLHPAGRILYTRGTPPSATELVIMEADGTNKVVLSNNALAPQTFAPLRCALSPDGMFVAFTDFDGGLYVMKAEPMHATNNVPVNVLEDVNGDPSGATAHLSAAPAWAPDGQNLAFANNANAHINVIEAIDDNGDIAPWDATVNPLVDVFSSSSGEPNVAWSPDGKYLAVTEGSIIQAFEIENSAGGIVAATPGTTFTLTDSADFATQKVSVAWSPDGMQIAFVEERPSDSHTRTALLDVRDVLGELTPESGANTRTPLNDFNEFASEAQTVSWSPDGSLLAVQATNAGAQQVETYLPEAIDAGTNPGTVLTMAGVGGDAFQPVFSQSVGDGSTQEQFVAFASAGAMGNEDSGPIQVTVLRTGGMAGTLTVDFTVDAASTADEDVDYTISESPLVFGPGEAQKTITITPINDDELESDDMTNPTGDETVVLTLSAPDIGDLGALDTTTVTIRDDETIGTTPFLAAATRLEVFVNNKLQKKNKGKGAFDATWRFEARQPFDNTQPGLALKMQYSETPDVEASWKDLPESAMARGSETAQTWKLTTNDLVPSLATYFRTYSFTTTGQRLPTPGPIAGPFKILGNGLRFEVFTQPLSRGGITYDNKGVPTFSTTPGDIIKYVLRYRNRGSAIAGMSMSCGIPNNTVLRNREPNPNNPPDYDASPGFNLVFDRHGEITAIAWQNIAVANDESGEREFRVDVSEDIRANTIVTDTATLLLPGSRPRKVPLLKAKVYLHVLLTTAQSSNGSFLSETQTAPGQILTYEVDYEILGENFQLSSGIQCNVPKGTTLIFTDADSNDRDDTNNFGRRDGEPFFGIGNASPGTKGKFKFTVRVNDGLKPGTTIPGPTFEFTSSNEIRGVKARCQDFNVLTPLEVTATRDGDGPVLPGGVIIYKVRAINKGGTTLNNVVVKFKIPAGTYYASSDTGGTFDADSSTVTWNLGQLTAGDAEILGVSCRVKYDYDLGDVVATGDGGDRLRNFTDKANRAGYSGSATDGSDNLLQATGDSVGVEVSRESNPDAPLLGIDSSVEADAFVDVPTLGRIVGIVPVEHAPPGAVSGRATVRFKIFNHGTVAATNVQVSGVPFPNMTFLNNSVLVTVRPGITFDPPRSPINPRSPFYTLFIDEIAPGEEIDFIYQVELPRNRRFGFLKQDAPSLKCTEYQDPIYATPGQLDLDCVPPVEYEISTSQSNQFVGTTTTNRYYITYRNAGVIDSKATIEVPIPFGLEYAGAGFVADPDDPNQAERAPGTDEALPTIAVGSRQTVVFDLGTLGPNERGQVRLDLRVANSLISQLVANKTKFTVLSTMKGQYGGASGAQRERGLLSGNVEIAPANTNSTTSVFVGNTPPRVHLVRSAPQTVPREVGRRIAYTIEFSNHGDQEATGVEVGMQIPYGTEYHSDVPGKTYVPTQSGIDEKRPLPFSEAIYKGRRITGRYWNINSLPGHSTGAVTLVVQLNQDGVNNPRHEVADRSAYIRGTNVPEMAGGKIVTETRSTNAAVGFIEGIARFFASIGSALNGSARAAIKDEAKEFTSRGIVFKISGADNISFNNGTFLIPIGGGRIVAGGGGNIVAGGGGNIVAGGGGNIVAGGGGNIVAAGGGNLIGSDGASIVAGGGGNFTFKNLAGGASLTANQILAPLIGDDGASVLALGGNIVAGGGGNLIALDGPSKGRLIGNDGAAFSAAPLAAFKGDAVQAAGAAVLAKGGSILSAGMPLTAAERGAGLADVRKGSVISVAKDTVVANDGAGVVANDGAGVVANDGSGIVAGGGGNFGPKR